MIDALSYILERSATWLPAQTDVRSRPMLDRARDYLQDNLFRDVTLTELASVADLSKFHFLRQFQREYGLPPHAFQLQQRVFRSKMLLRSLSTVDAAAECGFADQSHFHRVFQSHVGATPGCYAEQFGSRHAHQPSSKLIQRRRLHASTGVSTGMEPYLDSEAAAPLKWRTYGTKHP